MNSGNLSRRQFIASTAAAVTAGSIARPATGAPLTSISKPKGSVVIASANGLVATDKAMSMIRSGADALDAVIAGVNIVENDPADHSVGYGGLPNEDGVVELDSCVMHGPSCGAGAVAALRNVKTPSSVAKLVMQRTDHVMLVGHGALRFAKAHGFGEVDLLTDEARRIWLEWKQRHSDKDDWIAPPEVPDNTTAAFDPGYEFTYGTINCCAIDGAANLSGVTTTSGLSYKIPGRVGDSPIIGAGLYVDNKVGAAGSTGRGEAVLKVCGAHLIVERMRSGSSPVDACLDALHRIVETTTDPRLKRQDGRPNFNVNFYAIAKDGTYGAASIWSKSQFAVFANGRNRLEDSAFLYERPPSDAYHNSRSARG